MRRLLDILQDTSRWLAIGAVVLAPIPFGSVYNFWIASWITLLSISLLPLVGKKIDAGRACALLACALLAGAWLVVLALQSGWIFPTAAELGGTSATAQNPLIMLGSPLLTLTIFIRFLLIAPDAPAARAILRIIAVAGTLVGAAAFVAYLVEPDYLLGRRKIYYVANFTGTFVNRNTAATFFGTCGILWASRLMAILRQNPKQRPYQDWIGLILFLLDRVTAPAAVAGTALAICLGWTAMTASRAGFILTVLGISVIGFLHVRQIHSLGLLAKVTFAFLVVPTAILLLLGGAVDARINSGGLFDPYRLEVYRLCIELIRLHPWLGIGLGDFEAVFPNVRSETMGMYGIWEKAHSTPLEIAVEMGLPLALFFLVLILLLLWLLLRAALRSPDFDVAGVAFAVGLLGLLHSCIDFSLQIPGYAAFWSAIVAIGLGQACARAVHPAAEAKIEDEPKTCAQDPAASKT